MFHEAAEAPERVERQCQSNRDRVEEIAARLCSDKINMVLTCARGSSAHAAVYGKYLIEGLVGKPVAAFAPSMASIYGADLHLHRAMFLAVSQSGRSEDLLQSTQAAKAGGAFTVAMTNDTESPLAALCEATLPLLAGEEHSVAATKSFICSLTAFAALAFCAGGDHRGLDALGQLPAHLREAWAGDWGAALPVLKEAGNLFVSGRGPGLSIAGEAALKLKETSGLYAEALSAAELRHGPIAVLSRGFPILAFVSADEARQSVLELVSFCAAHGAQCLTVGGAVSGALALDCPGGDDPRLTPILQVQRFYRFANALSLTRGKNADEPPFLKKVTVTV